MTRFGLFNVRVKRYYSLTREFALALQILYHWIICPVSGCIILYSTAAVVNFIW